MTDIVKIDPKKFWRNYSAFVSVCYDVVLRRYEKLLEKYEAFIGNYEEYIERLGNNK